MQHTGHGIFDAPKPSRSAHILWIALKMWRSRQLMRNLPATTLSFDDLFVATLTNPKALLLASVLFPLEALYPPEYFAWSAAALPIVLASIGLGRSYLDGLL
ncbi:hypothetical protein [Burkholderia ubonensis]|uniref:hypothetical protein n=1 Tax=Burkholderia ubonensis TaxID=101571 RepID=UPI0012FA8F99|nr:hypothetical protein [Burkholderia ubonensis]